ncbi:MAG: hypothetical protein JZU52_07015 [Lamprocystis purpurea]|jgi:chromosome segregation ATPase|uniref:hypothetical protein n=1 Tax=Lamprocystis purpurea TaxID=61598 RepID=UPI0003710EE3|nr:hypothetical protein [Lamprocystis purpurea]MBV5273389.1 hypothetical protein [Lamprocystis purpurea]
MDIIRANYEMTAEECDLYVKLFQKSESDQRFYLLKIREEKGWKAKGFESFDAFGESVLGVTIGRLNQLARAAEVQLSIGNDTIVSKIPEGQLRPLAPLTDEERRTVWAEATAKAEEDGRKLTARLVQEAVDKLQEEKESWRQQAIGEKKTRTVAEQKAETAQAEAATLRRTLALEAERLAQAKVMEARAEIRHSKEQADKLKDTIKSLKHEREDAIQRGVTNKLREQQSTLDSREAQLVSLEQRIAFLKSELEPLTEANQAVARHRPRIVEADHLINSIAVLISDAFDPAHCGAPPEEIRREWEHGAKKIDQLAEMIRLAISGGFDHE